MFDGYSAYDDLVLAPDLLLVNSSRIYVYNDPILTTFDKNYADGILVRL